jgi:hypothetical protein
MLRVYGSLTPVQRQTLLRGGVLPYAGLSPGAQRWVRRALQVRLDNDCEMKREPVDAARTVFSLRARSAKRSVTAAPNGFRILYRPLGGVLDYDAPVERVDLLSRRAPEGARRGAAARWTVAGGQLSAASAGDAGRLLPTPAPLHGLADAGNSCRTDDAEALWSP